MIYPMIVGLLLNTFCPQVFEIGGFFTAACRGGSNTIVAAILLFVGAGISFKSTPGAIKTGIVVLIPKLVVAAALGLGVAYFFNDNFLGLSSVSIIGGITFCNMALYTGIMGEFKRCKQIVRRQRHRSIAEVRTNREEKHYARGVDIRSNNAQARDIAT